MKRLLVATWGLFLAWGRARYRAVCGGDVESRTSLEPLARCYEPDSVIVAVPDSVAFPSVGKGCSASVVTAVEGIMGGDVESYREVVSRAAQLAHLWIQECGGDTIASMLEEGSLRIAVIPWRGVFNGWSFGEAPTRGGEENVYRNYSLRLLLEILEELQRLGDGEVEVIADLTHGQNYMPVALSREGAEASRLYAASQGPEARVAVSMWMSDPFMGEGSELELHRVSAASIRGRDAADSLARDLDEALRSGALSPGSCDRFFSLDPSRARQVMERLSGVVKTIDMKSICLYGAAAARAVIYSMPLAAVYIAGGVGERYGRRILERVLRVARATVDLSDGLTELRRGDGLVRVSPPLLLSERLRHLLYAAALLDYLSAAVPREVLEELRRFGGVSTDALRRVVKGLSRLYEAVALSELDSLEKKCLGGGGCPIPVGRGGWPGLPCRSSDVVVRNLKAHGGLERNVVEGMAVEGRLFLRYRCRVEDRPGSCWGLLLGVLSSPGF